MSVVMPVLSTDLNVTEDVTEVGLGLSNRLLLLLSRALNSMSGFPGLQMLTGFQEEEINLYNSYANVADSSDVRVRIRSLLKRVQVDRVELRNGSKLIISNGFVLEVMDDIFATESSSLRCMRSLPVFLSISLLSVCLSVNLSVCMYVCVFCCMLHFYRNFSYILNLLYFHVINNMFSHTVYSFLRMFSHTVYSFLRRCTVLTEAVSVTVPTPREPDPTAVSSSSSIANANSNSAPVWNNVPVEIASDMRLVLS